MATDLSVAVAGDDLASRRRALAALSDAGLHVAAEAGAPSDWAPESLMRVGVVVICTDIGPQAGGASLHQLREELGDRKLVVVSPSPDPIAVRRLLNAGIEGLVAMESLELALAVTVRAVSAGQTVLPHSSRRQLDKPALTSREKQVLGMVTLGFANGEIAEKLYLAESTVKSHLSSAFAKLGVRSRSEATKLILDPDGPLGPGILRISNGEGDHAPFRSGRSGS